MGHKVLLADDSITVQKIVKLSLTEEGIEVIAVGNGEQAVQQLESLQPDLIMADVFMPGKDGYEVCEFVKSHPRLRHIPVILLVHAFEPFDPDRAKKVGADHQLTKPFQSIRTLVTTVQDLLQAPSAAEASASILDAEPTTAMPAQTSVAPLNAPHSAGKPADEEFAVVSSLPTASAVNPGTEEALSMPSLATATLPVSFASPLPVPRTDISFPIPPIGNSDHTNADFLPPTELPVLPQVEWQASTPVEQKGWEPTSSALSAPINLEPAGSFVPVSLTVTPLVSDNFSSDDVLDLSDDGEINTVATVAGVEDSSLNSFTTEVPLLAVLGNTPAAAPETAVSDPSPESNPLSFTGSFDVGTGDLEPPMQDAPIISNSSAQDFKIGSLAQPSGSTNPSFPEEIIEEIVNRVVQRLSTKAIQEIAWEVVPEMAELLLRKHISQQQQLTH